jgi:hypothetical protein
MFCQIVPAIRIELEVTLPDQTVTTAAMKVCAALAFVFLLLAASLSHLLSRLLSLLTVRITDYCSPTFSIDL